MNKDLKANQTPRLVRASSIEPTPTPWGQKNNLLDWEATGDAVALFYGRAEPNARIPNDNNEIGLVRIESGQFKLVTNTGQFILLPNDTVLLSEAMHLENGDDSGTFYSVKSRFDYRSNVPKIIQSHQWQCFEALEHNVDIVIASEEVESNFCVIQIETQSLLASRPLIHENADCVFIVRQGSYEFCLNDARIHAMTGDCIFVPRKTCRSFRVISTQSGRLDLLAIPGGFDRYLHEASRLFPNNTTMEQEFLALGMSHGIRVTDIARRL